MGSLNPEEFEGYEGFDQRAAKVRKRKHPRNRGFVGTNKAEQDRKIAEENRAREAKEIITKQLSRFPSPDSFEGERQAKIYARWLRDSLEQDYPILSEGDVRYEYYVASVHAGGQNRQRNETAVRAIHTPTFIEANNADERDRPENQTRAYSSLYPRLEHHLDLWKDILKPEGGNPALVENKVYQILQEVSAEKQKT